MPGAPFCPVTAIPWPYVNTIFINLVISFQNGPYIKNHISRRSRESRQIFFNVSSTKLLFRNRFSGCFPFSVHPAKLFGIFLCILSAFLFFLLQFVVSLHQQKPPAGRGPILPHTRGSFLAAWQHTFFQRRNIFPAWGHMVSDIASKIFCRFSVYFLTIYQQK